MPVSTRKNKDGSYSNRTPGGLKGKHMTKKNAVAQKRLLNAIEHNPNFVPRHRKKLHAAVTKKY